MSDVSQLCGVGVVLSHIAYDDGSRLIRVLRMHHTPHACLEAVGRPVRGDGGYASLLFGDAVEQAFFAMLGQAPTARMAEVAGISETTLRKKELSTLRGKYRERAIRNLAQHLEAELRQAGVTGEAEKLQLVCVLSAMRGPASLLSTAMASSIESAELKALVARIDAFELELEQALAAGELNRAWCFLGDATRLAPEYRMALVGTSLPSWPDDSSDASDLNLRARLLVHRANVALSLLAMIDHDMIQWLSGHSNVTHWLGRSWLALLLVDANRFAGK